MSGATPNGFAASVVSVGDSATLLCAARTDRRKVTLVQHGTTDVFIGGDDVTTTTGVLLDGTAGAQLEIETTAAIYGIVGTSTQDVGVIEVFS